MEKTAARTTAGMMALALLGLAGCMEGSPESLDDVASNDLAVSSQTFATQRTVTVAAGARVVVVTSPAFAVTVGTKLWVTSRLRLENASLNTYIKGALRCLDPNGNDVGATGDMNDGTMLTHSRNILTTGGDILVLSPRMIVTALVPGPYTCELAFVNGNASSSTSLLISSYSYVAVNGPESPNARLVRQPNFGSVAGLRLAVGADADVAADNSFVIPDLHKTILFTGDVQWTSCRPSDDEVGCLQSDMANTASIKIHLSILQWNSAHTGYCSTYNAPWTTMSIIGTTVHHSVIYSSATYTPNPNCPADARVKIYVLNSGANAGDGALAVHAKSTALSAIPN